MKIRLKKKEILGFTRIETNAKIDSVVINEDLVKPEKESISILFKGEDNSGIINFATDEFNSITDKVRPYLGIVKKETFIGKSKKKEKSKI